MDITTEIKVLDLQISGLRRKIAKFEINDMSTDELKSDYYELLSLREGLKAKLRANGHKLSTQALRRLKGDMNLRLAVANVMGVGLPAVEKSIKLGGKSIAEHYDAMNTLHDKTGILINELRKPL